MPYSTPRSFRKTWPTISRFSIRAAYFSFCASSTRATRRSTVEKITGIPQDQFHKAADLFTSIRKDGDMKKVGTIIYAVGWTQHTSGTQTIRAAAMLQLLLGNVGRAGGGVNALRGHSNIQGATDMAGIFDVLPGYLKVPNPNDANLDAYLKRITPKPSKPGPWQSMNYWSNTPKFVVSLLKAMYGDAARKENDWAFDYLPKVDRNYSWVQIWDNMYRGSVKGLFAFGMNGVMIGPDSQKNIDALKKADWLVVGEIYPDETSEFWKSPGITPEEMKSIPTTVYRLPCAGFAEKDGSFTNSARWLQWKNAALPPPGDCRLDQAIVAQIFLKVRELYRKEGGKFPDPILNLTWGLHRSAQPVAGRSGEGDQRQGAGGHHRSQGQPDDQGGPATSVICLAARRWLDRVRQLDLFRKLDGGGPATGPARSRGPVRARHLSELGVELAGESPRALQPRLLQCGRQAVGPRPPPGVVERRRPKMGGKRCSGFQARLESQGPHGPVHHESGRCGPALCADWGGYRRTLPGVLRAHRKPDRQLAASRTNPIIRW